MAAIDKIYANREDYFTFQNWCKQHRPDALRYFYPCEIDDFPDDATILPATNFTEELDMWLLDNCPLDFVIERIRFQYNLPSTPPPENPPADP